MRSSRSSSSRKRLEDIYRKHREERCNIRIVNVIKCLKFVKVDFVSTLTTKEGVRHGISLGSSYKEC